VPERLRLARPEDAAAIQAVYAPYVETTSANFEVVAPTAAEMERRMRESRGLYPWLALELDGRLEGYAYATAWRPRAAYGWTAETTIYLSPAGRGGGRSRRLYGALLKILEAQQFVEAVGTIALPNRESVWLHESLGYRCVGIGRRFGFKLGEWRDVGWWSRPLAPRHTPPPPTIPVAELDLRVIEEALAFL